MTRNPRLQSRCWYRYPSQHPNWPEKEKAFEKKVKALYVANRLPRKEIKLDKRIFPSYQVSQQVSDLFSKISQKFQRAEKIRQNLLTFQLSSADLTSIWRSFLNIQILRKFQNFLSKTCWDTLELTLEAGISTVCPSSVCSKIHKQLPGSAQLIFVAEDPAPKFWIKSPLTCKIKIMGCLSNQTYGPG